MKIYLKDEDLIKELKELKDTKLNNVIDSYNKLCVFNSLSVMLLILLLITISLLSYSNVSEVALAILSVIIAIYLLTIGIISRFVIGKDYYKYIKDNNITILQNSVK